MAIKFSDQITKAQQSLISGTCAGWWPYAFNGETASTEATAWSTIALMQSHPQMAQKAIAFLLTNQNRDGGWSTGPGIGQSDWTSALAVLALRLTEHFQPDIIANQHFDSSLKNALHYLLVSRTDFMYPVLRLLLLLGAKGPSGLQFGKGWPWNKNGYSWVEPTAYCLMALKFPNSIQDHLTTLVISHGNKFLLDRTCKGGGWNHGAFYCLGEYCPPYILTTCEALLALIDVPADDNVHSSLDYLHNTRGEGFSAWSLSWSILTLDAYSYDCKHNLELLTSLQNKDGSFGTSNLVTALSLLALNTANGVNFFKLGAAK